jgi:hypothetical protein
MYNQLLKKTCPTSIGLPLYAQHFGPNTLGSERVPTRTSILDTDPDNSWVSELKNSNCCAAERLAAVHTVTVIPAGTQHRRLQELANNCNKIVLLSDGTDDTRDKQFWQNYVTSTCLLVRTAKVKQTSSQRLSINERYSNMLFDLATRGPDVLASEESPG